MSSYKTNLSLPKTDIALLLFRVCIAILMITHGYPKLIQLFGSDPIEFADPIGIGQTASLALTVFAEFVCSVLILIGLGTRLAVIPLIITMVVAVFIVHASDGMQKQELGLLYLISYILLFFTGSGKYSLDQYILQKK